MVLTVAYKKLDNPASVRMSVASLTFDSSYLTGGELLSGADVGLPAISFAICTSQAGYTATYIKSTGAVKLYWQNEVAASVLVEVTSTTNVATVVVDILCFYIPDGFTGT